MSDGFHDFAVSDPVMGTLRLMAVTPHEEDPWGILAPIRQTVWGSLIREVTGEALAHARHGYLSPLLQELGPHPKHLAQKVSDKDGMCVLFGGGVCAAASKYCRPGPKLPECYEPPVAANLQFIIGRVALAWRDGIYVVVVHGDEFNLL